MVIENVQTDQWFSSTIKGKQPEGTSKVDTTWAYEFVTDKPQIEIYLQVPDTLDMYQASLYAMSNTNSTTSTAPLSHGNQAYTATAQANIGGYSPDSDNTAA
jgi:hypothetical protein